MLQQQQMKTKSGEKKKRARKIPNNKRGSQSSFFSPTRSRIKETLETARKSKNRTDLSRLIGGLSWPGDHGWPMQPVGVGVPRGERDCTVKYARKKKRNSSRAEKGRKIRTEINKMGGWMVPTFKSRSCEGASQRQKHLLYYYIWPQATEAILKLRGSQIF